MSKYEKSTSDKDQSCADQKLQFQSKATIVLSDNDETDDDFDSLAVTVRARSSSSEHDVSASEHKEVSPVEPGSDSDQNSKPSLFTATSPRGVLTFSPPPSTTNSLSSASLAGVSPRLPASNAPTTGTANFTIDYMSQLIRGSSHK